MFLDDVDSLKAKLGIGGINPLMLIGVCLVFVVVVVGIVLAAWGGFSSPGVVVEQPSNMESADETQEQPSSTLFVHVAGEVNNPGMYELQKGSRVSDAINAAGGMLEGADQLSINLARELSDGEQIVVSSKVESGGNDGSVQGPSDAKGSAGQAASNATGKININTASVAELTALDGIGQATAEKIIAYRQANGSFTSIDGIKNVSGIGEKKYEAIKDRITV